MWTHERHSKILERLELRGKVVTQELASVLKVSKETVRRDLMDLEHQGSLSRVHGGAIARPARPRPEAAFTERLTSHAKAKAVIAHAACALIPEGSTLFVDTGTTTLAFAEILLQRADLNIITNSIEIAQLPRHESCDVILLGGRPDRDIPGTFGELTLAEIGRFLVDFAVISPVAFHLERGAMDFHVHEAEVARQMIRRANNCLMLCHAEKIGADSRVSICNVGDVDHLVTDSFACSDYELPNGDIHIAVN